MTGQTISHYKILEKLGEGGMGVVYKAEETRLERVVALKFLPTHLLGNEDVRKRFEREAKSAAALDHPNVCHVHEIDEAEGKTFIVMALVDGESLEKKIARGPLKLDETLSIAQQVAKGLEAAHKRGIVHRDIKPENIMVGEDGYVTIMDFGLAQLTEASRLTRTDETLGTVAYMSPEQTEGSGTDHRTDIWSLGVVLYEMITGQQPFKGDYDKAVMYSILNEQAEPMTAIRTGVPMELEVLVNKCLAKDRGQRYQSTAELVVDLASLHGSLDSGRSRAMSLPIRLPEPDKDTRGGVKQRLPWAVAALASTCAVALAFLYSRNATVSVRRPPLPAIHASIELPASAPLALGSQYPLIGFESPALALSPDGRHLAYVGQAEEGTRLYHRDLTRFEEPRPVPGSEGAVFAFFSPDSMELGFLTSDRVKKTALAGSAVTTLCQANTAIFAFWLDDTIYFSDAQGEALSSVPASGGQSTRLFNSGQSASGNGFVTSVLPNERAALVSRYSSESIDRQYAEIWVVSLDGVEGKALPVTGGNPHYVSGGYLVFTRGSSLYTVPFDLDRLEVTGNPSRVGADIAVDGIFGVAHTALAGNGMLAFVPGGDMVQGRLAWVDRQGNGGVLDVPERIYGVFDLAPDDRRFALQVADVRDYIWIFSADSGGRALAGQTRLGWPVWSPDGSVLAVTSPNPGSAAEMIEFHNLRTGQSESFSLGQAVTTSWSTSGLIGFDDWQRGVGFLSVDAPEEKHLVQENVSTGALDAWGAALSPDGTAMAYALHQGGRLQIWIDSLKSNTRVQVSTDGGVEPVWCRKCGEIFYRHGNRFFASRVTLGPNLQVTPPRAVFEAPDFVDTPGISYRVSSDGERLYYIRRAAPPVQDRIHIVTNWQDALQNGDEN